MSVAPYYDGSMPEDTVLYLTCLRTHFNLEDHTMKVSKAAKEYIVRKGKLIEEFGVYWSKDGQARCLFCKAPLIPRKECDARSQVKTLPKQVYQPNPEVCFLDCSECKPNNEYVLRKSTGDFISLEIARELIMKDPELAEDVSMGRGKYKGK